VLLAVRYLPNSMAEKRPHGIDIAGALAVVAGFLFLIFAIVRAQEWGWGSPRIIGLLVASVATFGAFAVIELSSRAPLIRLAIFRRRPIVASLGAMLALTSAAMGMFFFLSLYFQDVLGYSPLRSGVGFLPLSLAIGVAAFSSQRMLERVNARTILLAGLAILAAGLAIFTQLPSDAAYATRILPPMLISAAGLGLCFPPVIMIATNTVDADDAGLASGLINSAQQIGFALGLAVLATIAADRTTSVLGAHAAGGEAATARALVDGYHLAWAVAASVAVAGFVLVATLIRNRDLSMSAQMTPADPEAGGVPEFAFDTEEIA
jgi:predicted MFS family arabinose efflux permease